MKVCSILLACYLFVGCFQDINKRNSPNAPSNYKLFTDSSIVDSKYGFGIWKQYFQPYKIDGGATLQFIILNDSSYLIQWGDSLNLMTLNDTLSLDGHETWIPKYVAENEHYIVLRRSCGNPCWLGYFLFKDGTDEAVVIHEYLDFDLQNDLVVFIIDKNLEIMNLKTHNTERYQINGCKSDFIGYCLDSLSFENKVLKFKWIPETVTKGNQGEFKIIKIKI